MTFPRKPEPNFFESIAMPYLDTLEDDVDPAVPEGDAAEPEGKEQS